MKHFSVPKERLSGDAVAKCITTNGGESYHPSGLRNYTPRELAELQMFPLDYLFCGSLTRMREQIGNAVPPGVWEHYIRSVIQTLTDFDAGTIDEAGKINTQNQAIVAVPMLAGRSNTNATLLDNETRSDREGSRTISPGPVPSIETPFRPTEPWQAQFGSSNATSISQGKRKFQEAFIDLTIKNEAEHVPHRSIIYSHHQLDCVTPEWTQPALSVSSTRGVVFDRSSDNHIDLTGNSARSVIIDLTEH
jgi:hypothetical protein